jgi:hypothetical protein
MIKNIFMCPSKNISKQLVQKLQNLEQNLLGWDLADDGPFHAAFHESTSLMDVPLPQYIQVPQTQTSD